MRYYIEIEYYKASAISRDLLTDMVLSLAGVSEENRHNGDYRIGIPQRWEYCTTQNGKWLRFYFGDNREIRMEHLQGWKNKLGLDAKDVIVGKEE